MFLFGKKKKPDAPEGEQRPLEEIPLEEIEAPELSEILAELAEILDEVDEGDVAAFEEDLAELDAAEEAMWESVIDPDAEDDEMVTLDDGREFLASFVREIRALDAPDLRVVLDTQRELFTPEEYAYIEEVFAERLGDLN